MPLGLKQSIIRYGARLSGAISGKGVAPSPTIEKQWNGLRN